MTAPADAIEVVLGYHQRTRHEVHRYARALGYLDWDTQPDPFRRFEGAPRFLLDEVPVTEAPAYDALFDPEALPARPLDRASVSQFLYDSLALSAWKVFGENRWSLRVNPSSGNLHPTEGYLLTGGVPGLLDQPGPNPAGLNQAGLYHYGPFLHELELRRSWSAEVWNALGLGPGTFLVGLTSIHWRESWKYGERAFRYCQHDAGHAIAGLALSAAALGWRTTLLDSFSAELLSRVLGIDSESGVEAEHPETLLAISPSGTPPFIGAAGLAALSAGPVLGVPNTLSKDHHEWPIIEVVEEASAHPGQEASSPIVEPAAPVAAPAAHRTVAARRIIRQRRSAVSMDGETFLTRDDFLRMTRRTLPAGSPRVFQALPWSPSIHLAFFVHRVRGLPAGLYFLVRHSAAMPQLRAAMRPEFKWEPVDDGLYLLHEADARAAARSVSCGQEIAADGAFALGMIARFEPSLREHGAWFYRRLHWEAGAVGQVLYLEAEAAGVRATGIGCFFDDAMHEILGLRDATFRTLYHFTVGGPVEDPRLQTAPAYAHRTTPQ